MPEPSGESASGGLGVTVHVLVAELPIAGETLPELVHDGHLDGEAARDLAAAMLKDTAAAVAASGGELLVNHPPDPIDDDVTSDPGTELRQLLADAVPDPESVRFEPQVGETATARIENACRHLLAEDDVASVAVLDGRAPTVDRTVLDGAGMKLRRSEVVVAPAPNGQVSYLGLSEPLDLEGLDWPFELAPLVERATAEGLTVDFLSLQPWVGDRRGLGTVVAIVDARRMASRRVPEHTAAVIDSLGL